MKETVPDPFDDPFGTTAHEISDDDLSSAHWGTNLEVRLKQRTEGLRTGDQIIYGHLLYTLQRIEIRPQRFGDVIDVLILSHPQQIEGRSEARELNSPHADLDDYGVTHLYWYPEEVQVTLTRLPEGVKRWDNINLRGKRYQITDLRPPHTGSAEYRLTLNPPVPHLPRPEHREIN